MDTSLSVEDPGPAQDPVDRPDGGESGHLAGREDLMDRLGPVESQVAGLLQLPPHGQDLGLDRGIGSLGGSGDPRAVVPIDAIQPSPPAHAGPRG